MRIGITISNIISPAEICSISVFMEKVGIAGAEARIGLIESFGPAEAVPLLQSPYRLSFPQSCEVMPLHKTTAFCLQLSFSTDVKLCSVTGPPWLVCDNSLREIKRFSVDRVVCLA